MFKVKRLFIESEATSSPIILDNDNYTIGSSDTSFDFNEDYEVDSKKYRAKAKRIMYNTAASPELHIEKSNSSSNSKKKIKNKNNSNYQANYAIDVSTATKNEKKINKKIP